MQTALPMSEGMAPSDSLFASPGSKEKKDKPKNKTAQQGTSTLENYYWISTGHIKNFTIIEKTTLCLLCSGLF